MRSRWQGTTVLVATAGSLVLLAGAWSLRAAGQAAGPEAASPGQARMVDVLARIARTGNEDNRFLNPRRLETLRQVAARMPADAPEDERLELHLALGLEELTLGTAERAIQELEAAYLLFPDPVDDAQRNAKAQLAYHLGLAYLRWGERVNCVASHTGESCILPIRGGGLHADRRGSEQALRYFREVLLSTGAKTVEHLATKWLIALAHQTLGTDPGKIPRAERLPGELLAPEAGFPRFANVAPALGLDTVSHAGGAVVEDFDGDGDFDLLTSSWHPAASLHYFENAGADGFVERTAAANLSGLTGGLNLVQADYDNDGDADVLVLRGAWLGESGKQPSSLLRNDGGRFTDVTFDVGLGDAWYPTQTAAWADYDNDGDLDLYVGNENYDTVVAPGQLFRNDGGRFTDVAREAGVENLRFAKGVAWGDYDGDGDPDLYVSNLGEANRLYRNDGGTFVDVAGELGVSLPRESFPVWFWDYDNDGALDLYVSSYPNAPGPGRLFLSLADDLGIDDPGETARLYRGDGRGGFRDVSAEVGLDRVSMPMGANFGDLDNDGYLDFYLGTGYPSWDGLVPNELYWNRGGERFDEVATAAGLAHIQKGHGIAFADLDGDGDEDVFEQMGGFYPEDTFADALYENPGFGNHWLLVELVGTRSNRSAIGARVRADLDDAGTTRSIHRWIGSGGSFGADPLAEHLGLGQATSVETLEIHWPASGTTQTLHAVPADQAIRITEGEDGYQVRKRTGSPFRVGEPGHEHGV
jgi:hypothetical protein